MCLRHEVMRWIGAKIQQIPSYDATGLLSKFLTQQEIVPENRRILALDAAHKGTPTCWWATHKDGINSWTIATHLLQRRFEKSHNSLIDLYQGTKCPT